MHLFKSNPDSVWRSNLEEVDIRRSGRQSDVHQERVFLACHGVNLYGCLRGDLQSSPRKRSISLILAGPGGG